MEKLLANKTAIVTGGGSGIGRSIVLKLAALGANVAVADINEELASATAKDAQALGVEARPYVADISKIETHKEFVEKVEADFGGVDILVNNAGVSFAKTVLEVTPEMWDFVHGINSRGTFFLTQVVFAKMMEKKKGRIINIASISGDRPADKSDAAYCTSKAGIIMMSKVYAKAARDTDITVNSVSPGVIETPLTIRLGSTVDSDKVPMGRMGKPDEIADAVAFLASDMASYISGQNIRVNGGQFML
ncbi:MAG: SDR family oxidoreductase [Christensenellaceae bacterium]|nr:SDR family oxidoreductase [Christensenellaceae bacterium]